MESIRSALHAIVVFLSSVLDPVVNVLARGGSMFRVFLDSVNIPPVIQPAIVIGCWIAVILLLIRFLRGSKRLVAIGIVVFLWLRIYGVLSDI